MDYQRAAKRDQIARTVAEMRGEQMRRVRVAQPVMEREARKAKFDSLCDRCSGMI